ncbi:helix-turn-helix domain-containing protein [Aliidiomarina haloalkalitolerans]|uniref:Winged helix-turn-helix domain-containing protein n=1 Tax=Aliidiomarina haloalkalitolerans TaxID=859059 RepID=A0A432VPB8_9GAMM|nr:hypothetical protein CWE06_12285 [Aliidiomarina haloalkalitolerans]
MNLTFRERKLLEELEVHKSMSTVDLHKVGLCSPNTIVYSLRKKGYSIETSRKDAVGHAGVVHRAVAHYSLVGGNHE